MNLLDSFLVALQALRANLLRSILTMLGIVIGVASVVAMIAIGSGAETSITNFIQGLGSNIITISPGAAQFGGASSGAGSRPTLTLEDAQALEENIDHLESVAASAQVMAQLIAGPMNWRAQVKGATENIFVTQEWTVEQGRLFTAADQRGATKVAVIGQTVAENLFPGQDPIGAMIRINRVPFRVIGLLADKGSTTFGQDQDDTVYVPLSTAKQRLLGRQRLGGSRVGSITVKVSGPEWMDYAEAEIREVLRYQHKLADDDEDDFNIFNLAQILETSAATTRVLTLFLAAVASVSLLVGGIGIMNIMLVSVTERTREIGLRMAVGARRRDILTQFLIESTTLSLLGGLIGIGLGILMSVSVARIAGWPTTVPTQAMLLAFGFAALIGIFFGMYPASRAAKLDPIEALRYE